MTLVRLREPQRAGLPPFVLLHGMLGSPESFRGFAQELRYEGAVLAGVLPGHLSPAKRVSTGFGGNVGVVGEELPARCFLLGYSLGGRVALALAVAQPARVAGVVAVGAHAGLGDQERSEKARWEHDMARQVQQLGLPAFVRNWESLPLFATQLRLPDSVQLAQRAIRESHEPAGIAQAFRALGSGNMPQLHEGLRRASVPLLFVAGSEDSTYRERARALCVSLPRARSLVLEGAGHNPVLERPAALAAACDQQLQKWLRTGETSDELAQV